MEILIPLLIVIIILGAILGGKSFGGTVRKGCGFIILLIIIIVALGVIFYSESESKNSPNNKEAASSSNASAYFIVKQDCQTYTKPNIKSNISGHLEVGKELLVKNVNKFNYFYEVSDEKGKNSYVRKECLIIK
jgi:uncharacterized protein YpmB